MFCENCGAKIADNDMFCQNCGKRIELPAAQPAPEQSVNQAEPETSVQESEQTVQSEEIPAQQVTTAVAEP
ncbi:zinc-ribbon domain-containing protein, partial [Candidatus Pseudoruminococcus sp.]|uniref:zinc-ribbon domain-containing protein n=1 Tax=Candidatus Pseudoruminococcus sp. TaxID=3101048 RepID=UPI00399B6D9B